MSVLSRLAQPILKPIRALRGDRSRRFVLRQFPSHSVGAEIGVWAGDFSQQILEVVQPSKLHLIDPWLYQPSPEFSRAWYGGVIGESQQYMDQTYRSVVDRMRPKIVRGIVEIHRGSSDKMAEQFPDNYFDWIYVDGDHRFEGVLKDLELYRPKLKTGGIMGGDDYENVDAWWGDGVPRAVNDVLRRGLYKEIVIRYNQFVLRKE